MSSSSTQPYSKVWRGRMPSPFWVRLGLIALAVAAIVAIMAWLYLYATPTFGRGSGGGPKMHFTAGGLSLDMPPAPAPAAAPQPPPPQAATPAPQPLAPAPAAEPATPSIPKLVRVWSEGAKPGTSRGEIERRFAARQGPSSADTGSSPGTAADAGSVEATVDKDVSLLLPAGAQFECVPLSPLNTQSGGPITCEVGEDVWSYHHLTKLIEKGAFAKGDVLHIDGAQDRAPIIFHDVRSDRVKVDLNAPAGDELGQIGAPGVRESHLWQKIQGAALLTVFQGGINAATAVAARGNNNTYLNFSAGQSLGEQLLAHDINIQPDVWRGQGWPITIHVEHDIWFRRAYDNRLVAGS